MCRLPPRPIALGGCILAVALLGGCDDGSVSVSGSLQEAQVRGTVVIRGKPAREGFVVFDPANVRRRDVSARRGKIEEDGTYSLTTLIGENRINLEGAEISRAGLEIASRRTVDVGAGENTIPIEVPVPGAPSGPMSKQGPR